MLIQPLLMQISCHYARRRSKSCPSGIRELNQRPRPATYSFVALDKSSFTSLSLSVNTWIADLDLSFPHSLSLIHHQVLSAVPPKHIRNRPTFAHLHELPSSPSHHISQLDSCCASSWPPCLHSCSPHSPLHGGQKPSSDFPQELSAKAHRPSTDRSLPPL